MGVFVLDLETGGLDPKECDIFSISCVYSTKEEPVADIIEIHTLEKYPRIERSLLQSGFPYERYLNRENFSRSVEPSEAIHRLEDFFTKHMHKQEQFVFVGQNFICFDAVFLRTFYERHGWKHLLNNKKSIIEDTKHMARTLANEGRIKLKKFSLVNLCEHFQIELGDESHTAIGDAIATAKVYWELKKHM